MNDRALSSSTVIAALGALAQDHRLAAFRALVGAGPQGMAAGSLARALGVAPSSMSFHLGQLASANLVTQRRDGRSIVYAANFPAVEALIAYLTENCCAGTECRIGQFACDPATS